VDLQARPERGIDPQLVDRVHEDGEVVREALEEHLVDLRRQYLGPSVRAGSAAGAGAGAGSAAGD
jgi:hypothetical protein